MEKSINSYIKLFTRFLKEKGAYGEFFTNFKFQYSIRREWSGQFGKDAKCYSFNDFAKLVKQKNFLQYAFDWSSTDEKHNYWENLNREWIFYATGVLGFDDF